MFLKHLSALRLFSFLFILLVLTLTSLQPVSAGKSGLESLLPSSMLKKDFKTPYEYTVYDETSLFEYINGGAPFYIDRGFEELITNEYKKGDDSFLVDIYRMENAESASKLFKDIKKNDREKTSFGEDGQMGSNQAEFFRDKYFVRIVAFKSDTRTLSIVKEFAESVDFNIKEKIKRNKK